MKQTQNKAGQNQLEKKAKKEINQVFAQVAKILEFEENKETKQKMLFEYLSLVHDAPKLLSQAWKISSIYKINNESVSDDFIKIYLKFEKIKKRLKKEIKQQH
ncbi:hypothetical protein GYA19_05030 [Candidatus Beckwithbacteria bacterium]|nr:hypothetical protein [Candidatus Beckwithbacteria bacterium]